MKPGIIGVVFFCGILSLGFGSCAYKKTPAFPVYTPAGSSSTLFGRSKNAAAGIIPLKGSKPLIYLFQKPLALPPDTSLEVEYGFRLEDGPAGDLKEWKDRYRIVLKVEGEAPWELPWDGVFLGAGETPEKITYGIPLLSPVIEKFSLTLETRENAGSSPAGGKNPVFQIRSLRFLPRWFGFIREGESAVTALRVTPFVSGEIPPGQGALSRPDQAAVIDPLPPYRAPGTVELSLYGSSSRFVVSAGKVRYEYTGGPENGPVRIPLGAFSPDIYPLVITGEGQIDTVHLAQAPGLPFPGAIPADPGIILVYDRTLWRDRRYEVFQWEHFPSVLIFDTADYAVQDRLFKRIAFFVEKKGVAGRLVGDQEMADIHGWNAHDYRAEDLAAFFTAARIKNFPLSPEEEELEIILRNAGILNPSGPGPGVGAVLSVSRESSDYLRGLFMVHEGFHGLFFIDPDFQEFCRRRWEGLNPAARRFLRSYFDYQGYDVDNTFLVINEFMAHCLQQPVSRVGWYFGEVLAGRINESSWRREVLPPMDEATGTWPDLSRAFTREAEALSSYVNRRWGFTAGRIRRLTATIQD
ncbi:MAG: hypothetical protein LBB78_03570 [Spirochaetaceae bacterium]|jgi:hypothetical protein|nr:hypothetical protein [Spirochaetaceae bacterium]